MYGALVYAAASIPDPRVSEMPDDEIQRQIDGGELGEVEVSRDGSGVRVHASRWYYTGDYDGEFDTQEEFRACLENSIDTGDLSEPKIRKITTIESREEVHEI